MMIRRWIAGLVGTLIAASAAWGELIYDAPEVAKPSEVSTAMEWGIGAIFLVGCLVVAFKPSKRSNLK